MKLRATVGSLLVLASGMTVSACGSPCVTKGDQISVELIASKNLNNTGSGAQQAPFRLWAVTKAGVFKSLGAEQLCRGKVDLVEAQNAAKAFATGGNWIAPGAKLKAVHEAEVDGAITHVAIAMMIPQAVLLMIPLDCNERDGYVKDDNTHKIRLVVGKKNVALAGDKSKE